MLKNQNCLKTSKYANIYTINVGYFINNVVNILYMATIKSIQMDKSDNNSTSYH